MQVNVYFIILSFLCSFRIFLVREKAWLGLCVWGLILTWYTCDPPGKMDVGENFLKSHNTTNAILPVLGLHQSHLCSQS
jgi:hypothetical protein